MNLYLLTSCLLFVCSTVFFILLLSINDPGEGRSRDEFPGQDYMMLGQEVGPRSRMEMRL